MYSPRLSPYAHSNSADYPSSHYTTSQTAALESQISSLQVLLLSHLAAPPWLPPQYPHSELLRQWDFLRLKFGSEIWRALRGRAGSFGAEGAVPPTADTNGAGEQVRYRRKYKATETALARCCAHLRRGIWEVFLPGLEEDVDRSMRVVERRLAGYAAGVGDETASEEAAKAGKAAREWRIMTIGLLLQTESDKKRTPKERAEKPLPPTPEEKEKGIETGTPDPLQALALTIAETLLLDPPTPPPSSSSPEPPPTPHKTSTSTLTKKIHAAVREIADSAISLRVQRDEEGELEVFFPREGESADGSEVIEVGADVDEDEDDEEEVEDGEVGSEEARDVAKSEDGQPLERSLTGGSAGSARQKAGGGVVGVVVWPGLKHRDRVVRKAEVMFLATGTENEESKEG